MASEVSLRQTGAARPLCQRQIHLLFPAAATVFNVSDALDPFEFLAQTVLDPALDGGEAGCNWKIRDEFGQPEKGTPQQHACTADDIADSVVSMVEGHRYMTGETILVDAGSHLGFSPLVAR